MTDWEINSTSSDDSDENGKVKIQNPHIPGMPEDVLYHFALGTKSHDLKAMFSDVRFVVVGGSPRRMEKFAYFMCTELKYTPPAGLTLINIAGSTDRYAMYKVGPVLSVSHGIGVGSISIMIHEVIKILHHAGVYSDVQFFRIGTSGGIGLEPGTVVVSDCTVDALFKSNYDLAVLGKVVSRPAILDKDLANELAACSLPGDKFQTIKGTTMCTLDFYEGQGRLDGAFCDYTEQDKMDFLKLSYENGVRNIEMESLCFAAMLRHANIKGAVACVTLLDRLKGDQVNTPEDVLKEYGTRPQILVARIIKKKLGLEE